MKIIFLNMCHGRLSNQLKDFLMSHIKTVDVFCLSEISTESINILSNKFRKLEIGLQAIFIRKGLIYKNYNYLKICKEVGVNKFIQGVIIISNTKSYSLFNVWGRSLPGSKLDSEIRTNQTKRILGFVKKYKHPHILIGDFNLLPETQSIKKFEEVGYKNLIKKFKIKTTRNNIAWNYFENSPNHKYFGKQLFADYCFVSKEIKVKSFEVPDIEISDHLPLVLEFEV